jgi:SAM-dependent methyltransferase
VQGRHFRVTSWIVTNHQNRFSTRVENYIKYRPGYPVELLNILESECGLTKTSVIADVGSGTGILSELFLKNGNTVFGVEPNEPMRVAGERLLGDFKSFISINGSAEATGLEPISVDFVTAGQAFHWFDRSRARNEFQRILRADGWVVLIWNERLIDTTPFLREYEELLIRYGTDYQEIRHENAESGLGDFFGPAGFQLQVLPNAQLFDLEALRGRLHSSSYVPEPGHPDFDALNAGLEKVFDQHQLNGRVSLDYHTKMFYGRLS